MSRQGQRAELSLSDAARSIRLPVYRSDVRARIGRRVADVARKYLQTAERAASATWLNEWRRAKRGRTSLQRGSGEIQNPCNRTTERWQRFEVAAFARARLEVSRRQHMAWQLLMHAVDADAEVAAGACDARRPTHEPQT